MSELINKVKTKYEIRGEVQVTKVYPELENLTVEPTKAIQSFNHPDSYGYNNVMVKAIDCEPLSVVPQKEDQNFDGMYDKVTVKAIKCNTLDITPKQENQTFDGMYDKVNVDAIVGDTLNVRPAKYQQTFNGLYEKVNVAAIQADTLNVTPTKESQTFNGLYEKVNVEKMNLETLNVKPSKEPQTFNGAYEKVNVDAMEIKLQEKTVEPTLEEQEISTDNGYDGLNKVTVKAIETEDLNVTPSLEEQIFNGLYGKVTVKAFDGVTDVSAEIVVSPTEPTGENRKAIWVQKNVRNLIDEQLWAGAYNSKSTLNRVSYYGNKQVYKGKIYTFNTNIPSNYQFAISIGNMKYPVNSTSNLILDSGWKAPSEAPYTFTAPNDGYLGLGIRRADNGYFDYDRDDVSILNTYKYQVEEGTVATEYEGIIEPKMYLLNENDEYVEVV